MCLLQKLYAIITHFRFADRNIKSKCNQEFNIMSCFFAFSGKCCLLLVIETKKKNKNRARTHTPQHIYTDIHTHTNTVPTHYKTNHHILPIFGMISSEKDLKIDTKCRYTYECFDYE